ncbi:hypothetical protein YB2330_000383 [Saitoella coloradoensis]
MDPNDDAMWASLPVTFGKQTKKANVTAQYEATKRGGSGVQGSDAKKEETKAEITIPKPASPRRNPKGDDSDSDPLLSDSDSEDGDNTSLFPISHELILKDHTKPVSALSLDPSGARLISGSYDYNLKLWDFAGMDPSTLRPFRSLEPNEGKPVHHVEWSITGHSALVIPASSQAQLVDRDGDKICEFVRGDMYIRDLRGTSGHVAELTSGTWHPTDTNQFVTASADGTVRVWDVNNTRKQVMVGVHKSKIAGAARVKISAVGWSPDARFVGAAAVDGTVSLWDGKARSWSRPAKTIDAAHLKNTETSGIVFSRDGNFMATRGGDETVKVWDTRNLKTPLATRSNVFANNAETNIIFSPDNRYLLTGTSVPYNSTTPGTLEILHAGDLKSAASIPISNSSVIRVLWHSKINQIITGSANGEVRVLYSPEESVQGAKLCVGKAPRIRHIDEDPSMAADIDPSAASIILPNARPEDRNETFSNKTKANMARKNPILSRRPQIPAAPGPLGGTPDQRHVDENIVGSDMRNEDPREALLKFAEIAEKDPMFFGVYKKNQPRNILAGETGETGEEEEERKKRRRIL